MGQSFRLAWRSNLPTRVLDACLHIALAAFLPGAWWYQYLPDVLVPVLLIHSLMTDKWLAPSSPLLRASKLLHSSISVAVCAVLAIKGYAPWWLMAHWLCHLVVDMFTHDGWHELERKGMWG